MLPSCLQGTAALAGAEKAATHQCMVAGEPVRSCGLSPAAGGGQLRAPASWGSAQTAGAATYRREARPRQPLQLQPPKLLSAKVLNNARPDAGSAGSVPVCPSIRNLRLQEGANFLAEERVLTPPSQGPLMQGVLWARCCLGKPGL